MCRPCATGAHAGISSRAGGQQQLAPTSMPAPQTRVITQPVDHDSLLDVPPLPKGQVSLVGGIVTGIDRVRNKLTVRVFAGKK